MPEKSSPTAVFYGSSGPDRGKLPPYEPSTVTKSIRQVLGKWFERIGPKGVENHVMNAHKNIVDTLPPGQRKEVFIRELQTWRTIGELMGIGATVIDVSLAAVGAGLSIAGFRNPNEALYQGISLPLYVMPNKFRPNYAMWIFQKLTTIEPYPASNKSDEMLKNIRALNNAGRKIATLPGIGSLAILATGGPAHRLAHLAARGAETIGKHAAKSSNKEVKEIPTPYKHNMDTRISAKSTV